MRYKITTLVAAAALVIVLASCSSGGSADPASTAESADDLVTAAQAEGTVTLYTGIQDFTFTALQEAFDKEYGITLEMGDRLSSAALAQRIDADVRGTGRIGADVVITTDQALSTYLGDEGLSIPLVADDYAGLDPTFVQTASTTCAVGLPVVAWNTEVMGPDFEIAAWDDLLDPAIGSKIMVSDPRGSAAWATAWSSIYNSEEVGEEFVSAIGGSGYQPVASSLVALEQLVAGQGGVQMFGPISIFDNAIEAGQPIKYWLPEEPAPAFFNFCLLAAETEHPNAGALFLQWLMGPEGQTILNDNEMTASPLGDEVDAGVPLPADFLEPPAPFKVQQDLPTVLGLLGFN